jgi:hypothetical protein
VAFDLWTANNHTHTSGRLYRYLGPRGDDRGRNGDNCSDTYPNRCTHTDRWGHIDTCALRHPDCNTDEYADAGTHGNSHSNVDSAAIADASTIPGRDDRECEAARRAP